MLLKHQNGALLIIFLTPFACDNEAIKQNQSQNKNGVSEMKRSHYLLGIGIKF